MAFNSKYFNGTKMLQLLPKAEAFSTYVTPDNIVIGIFQGKRGANPLLDFKVRILQDGITEIPVLPPHTYWVVDLMLKCVDNSTEVSHICKYYLNFYATCNPFQNQPDRDNYKLQTLQYITSNYGHLNNKNSLSMDYVAIIIELFCLNEKQTPGAYMFRDLLQKIYDYSTGAANYIQLLEAAKPGFR